MTQDFKEAFKWFRQAAEQGYPSAQYNLARYYVEGKAVETDLVEAYKWYLLASERGDPDADRERLELSLKISPTDMAEAIRRATQLSARWQPVPTELPETTPGQTSPSE